MLQRLPVTLGATLIVIIVAFLFAAPAWLIVGLGALVFVCGLFMKPLTNS